MSKKSINIYMGIIGEAYVDKETAYAVLLAAKKNILDVQAIIKAAEALDRPITIAINNAGKAIDAAVGVYEKLKNTIKNYSEDQVQYRRLFDLLGDLNQNDFDDDFSNGGNIYTARENKTFAESLYAEVEDILYVAQQLLDANKLNAVVRCKEYNIAKEIFESMIPERIISPEDLSDAMEAELLRRIAEVQNNVDYVNIVSDEIINVSNDVDRKIDDIVANKTAESTNETLYWYAGNLNPLDLETMENYGFEIAKTGENNYYYKPELDEYDRYIPESLNKDFGIDGPLKANKWFHHPLHLIQDGQLIAGVDGGKSKYKYWYVAVPRYILTGAGSTAYKLQTRDMEDKPTKQEWAIAQINASADGKSEYVDSLYPCKPKDYEHIDGPHDHEAYDNYWIDINENGKRDKGDDNEHGYELITNETNFVAINGIIYDVWRCDVTIYNAQRLNVYFNFGEPEDEALVTGMYYYLGTAKPNYNSDILNDSNWVKIESLDPITPNKTIGSKVFYVAIPDGFGIFDANDVDQSLYEIETTSPYTLIYATTIGGHKYQVFITGNEAGQFTDTIKPRPGQEIVIPDEPGGDEPGGDTPGGDTPGGDTPGGDTPEKKNKLI